MTLSSALYRGTVSHARRAPFERTFSYPLYMLYLDLDELRRGALPVRERPGLLWFRRADYLGPVDVPLDEAVRALVRARIGRDVGGPIRVLTNVRSLGYVFNPVTFYYCFDDAATLGAVVAEIHNTPWGERHAYVLEARDEAPLDDPIRATFDKAFHVSPFFRLRQTYAWRFSRPTERLVVEMDNVEDEPVHRARLELRRAPLTRANLASTWARHPAMGLAAHAAIYWQALRLFARGAPFHTHPSAAQADRRTRS